MARRPTFVPRYDKDRGEWCLNIPAKMSDTGKRQRLYWPRGEEDKAIEHGRRLREGKQHFGERAKGIKPELMEAAVKWNETAIEFGYRGLDHFCTDAFARLEAGSLSPTLGELLDGHEADHSKNWSGDYKSKRWKPFRRRLSEIEELRISVMDEEWWRQWMKNWSALTQPGIETYNQQIGMVRSLFERTVAKKVHPINPLDGLPAAKQRGKKVVPVSSAEDVVKLLSAAWQYDLEMVPYFATCYFAGPRPDSEAKTIHFEHYDWKEGHLKIGITKTSNLPHRFVPIEDALRAWMRPFMGKKGSIIPSNFTKRRRRLIYGAHTTPGAALSDPTTWEQLVPWGHDITRHSYGSNWEAEHRTEAGCREALVSQMGHENFKTFKSYYLNSRTRAEARAYWGIRPPPDVQRTA